MSNSIKIPRYYRRCSNSYCRIDFMHEGIYYGEVITIGKYADWQKFDETYISEGGSIDIHKWYKSITREEYEAARKACIDRIAQFDLTKMEPKPAATESWWKRFIYTWNKDQELPIAEDVIVKE